MQCTILNFKLNDGNGGFQTLSLTTAPFDVVLNGVTASSTGDVLGISDSESSGDVNKIGIVITASGIDPTFQASLDGGGFIRAPVDVLICNIPEGTNVVDYYTVYHRGYCDTPMTTVDYETGKLSIALETNNVFIDIDKIPRLLRSSLASHSSRHAGDLFYQYTADVNVEETWKG